MGQATVDLPTSPEQSPAPLNSADDLLSQLAGAEIDRLLAEAEPESVAESDPELDAAFAEAANAPATEAEIDELIKTAAAEQQAITAEQQAATKPAPAAAPAAPTAQASADEYAAQVDALFAELNASTAEVEPAPEVEKEAPAPSPVQAVAPTESTAPADLQTSTAEKNVLAAPVTEPEEDESIYPLRRPVEKPTALVRMLEIFNAPFAACSDSMRDVLGKIAILTTMNSLAVLLYLYLFKR